MANKYAVLINPSYNRVFYESSKNLMINELKILDEMVLNSNYYNYQLETIGGIDYITFEAEDELSEKDLDYIARLSAIFCLFEVKESSPYLMKPILLDEANYFSDDIISIQKYTGKTNEVFTKLLFNIAIFCSDYAVNFRDRLSILDPVAGRGTTLFQGLIYGYNVYGVEADKKATHSMMTFLKRYLMKKRYKHQLEQGRIGRNNRIEGSRFTFITAVNKEEYKNGDTVTIDVVQDDNKFTNSHFKNGSMSAVIGDLPYGVQHGSPSHQESLTRNPKSMVRDALPAWIKVLKPGGVIAVSWNINILPRKELEEVFTDVGLNVLHSEALDSLEHVVDASIARDILVAKKVV